MIIDIGYWRKVIRRIVAFSLAILVLCIIFRLSIFYIPFLIALVISMLIEPIIKWFTKKTKLERKKSAIIVLIAVFMIIIGILSIGITTLIAESSDLLSGLNGYIDIIYNKLQELINLINFDGMEEREEINSIIQSSTRNILDRVSDIITEALQSVLKVVTSLPEIGIYTVITIIATYFLCTDRFYMMDQLEHHFPREWVRKIGNHVREISSQLGGYLKAEFILIGIDFIIILIGLFGLSFLNYDIKYPLLVAIGIGFVDALPLVGAGTVMIPWAIFSVLNGNIKLAIAVGILYITIVVVRQFLEPKIVSSQIGIHPIFTLIAMYTGYKFQGILGMLIGPIVLIILKSIFGKLIDRGIVKTLVDKR